VLSKETMDALERRHRKLRDKRRDYRANAVLALAKEWSPAQAAEIHRFDETTCRHYFQRYIRNRRIILGKTQQHDRPVNMMRKF
jgi:hypothetical protein